MATYTATNVGIRQNFATLGDRNFEPDLAAAGTISYASNRSGLEYLGTVYNVGQTLPYDANGNTTYGPHAVALLLRYWEQGWIKPSA